MKSPVDVQQDCPVTRWSAKVVLFVSAFWKRKVLNSYTSVLVLRAIEESR